MYSETSVQEGHSFLWGIGQDSCGLDVGWQPHTTVLIFFPFVHHIVCLNGFMGLHQHLGENSLENGPCDDGSIHSYIFPSVSSLVRADIIWHSVFLYELMTLSDFFTHRCILFLWQECHTHSPNSRCSLSFVVFSIAWHTVWIMWGAHTCNTENVASRFWAIGGDNREFTCIHLLFTKWDDDTLDENPAEVGLDLINPTGKHSDLRETGRVSLHFRPLLLSVSALKPPQSTKSVNVQGNEDDLYENQITNNPPHNQEKMFRNMNW